MAKSFFNKNNSKLLLYTGLTFLLIALITRWAGGGAILWIPVFSLAIILKAAFLFVTIRSRKFKWSLWLILILTGVIMIFVSLLFKYVFPIPLLRDILFYGAITLKIAGLILLFIGKTIPGGRSGI